MRASAGVVHGGHRRLPRAQGLADGLLVEDHRLRDALPCLGPRHSGDVAPFSTPPGVVDDASYAIECAAVGEVDLAKLERQIRELEGRITWLEERFWPRVLRQRATHRQTVRASRPPASIAAMTETELRSGRRGGRPVDIASGPRARRG